MVFHCSDLALPTIFPMEVSHDAHCPILVTSSKDPIMIQMVVKFVKSYAIFIFIYRLCLWTHPVILIHETRVESTKHLHLYFRS